MQCREAFEDVYHYSWDKTGAQQELTPDQYMMFPPRVLGYSLGHKRWVQLLVSKLKDPRDADRAKFDSKLILNKESKDIIRKSVQAHGKANVVDYIPGKGKGLVILLWGEVKPFPLCLSLPSLCPLIVHIILGFLICCDRGLTD